MRALDLSLYLVLDPDLCGSAEGMVETAAAAAQAGATVVQLRAPNWKKRALAECARALIARLRPHGVPLIVNDHADVASAVGADGLHIGQDDLAPEDARRIIGPKAFLGLSVGNRSELSLADPEVVDYLGIGPVWATTTKRDAGAAVGPEGLRMLLASTALPAVAIGGINAARTPEVLQTGVDGIAVVSAICGQPDPAASTRQLREIIRQCATC